jgi:hypothetical protein
MFLGELNDRISSAALGKAASSNIGVIYVKEEVGEPLLFFYGEGGEF